MAADLSLAIQAHQAQDMVRAEELYRAFLRDHPDHPDATALLGVVVGARGDFDHALSLVNKAVAFDPEAGILRFHQGTVLMAAGQLPEALAALGHAVRALPHVASIHYNYANALRLSDRWDDAIDHYLKTLSCDPKFLDAYNNVALSLTHQSRYGEALIFAQTAVELNPLYGDGWLTLCNVAEKLKDIQLALHAGQRVTELMPENHYAWFGYGVALNRDNRDREAVVAYRRALDLNPDKADVWDNLAQSYQAMNSLDDAEQAFRKAIEVAGQTIRDEDLRTVEENEYGNRHWHLALIELLRGDYLRGFARYRSRVREIKELSRPSYPFPLWQGQNLSGKTVLVYDEQGYGDSLMLARFLPPLRAKGGRIVLSIHPALLPLLRTWNGADDIITHGEKVPECDYFCSLFDLPHLLKTTLDTLPQRVPYIPTPVIGDDKRLLAPPSRLKCGVVWGGSPLHLNDAKRSVPLKIFSKLFSTTTVSFFSFNRDLKTGDAALLSQLPVFNLVPLLTDFAQASCLASQMDLMIVCDTAMAHLSGALGLQTWILLPFAPDWRWLTQRHDSPWYPTARLFRQSRPDDWEGVISEVKAALELRASSRP